MGDPTGTEATAEHPACETVDFGTLRISFDERLLRPRGWTTAQSYWAAGLLAGLPPGDVLELCAGAGQIGLLATATSPRRLVCVDREPVAASYIRRNAQAAGMSDRVELRTGDLAEVLEPGEEFPLIIADPPWVPSGDVGLFPSDPVGAIDGGLEGTTVVEACIEVVARHLARGGVALLQLGTPAQAESVRRHLTGAPLELTETREYGQRGVLVSLRHPSA